jgi:hypothetical protein
MKLCLPLFTKYKSLEDKHSKESYLAARYQKVVDMRLLSIMMEDTKYKSLTILFQSSKNGKNQSGVDT